MDAQVLRAWARAIDGGPFSSLCWGERMAFDNPETLTLMGALAAWTDQVRLMTTVIVPQLHSRNAGQGQHFGSVGAGADLDYARTGGPEVPVRFD